MACALSGLRLPVVGQEMYLSVDFLLEWGPVLDFVLVCAGFGGGGRKEVVGEAVSREGLRSGDLFGGFLHWVLRNT